MKNFSNTYIFSYATGLILIVATLLSYTAFTLKPAQVKNIENKKKQDLLASINIASTSDNAEVLYSKYVTSTYVINSKGEKSDVDAFYVEVKKEISKDISERKFPVYECTLDDGRKNYIVPVRGRGLGGPIWGYFALDADFNTVIGVAFDHEAETPGLGAKITTDAFKNNFKGKKLFDESNKFVSISMVKAGTTNNDIHKVDAISGGTITSNGVNEMIKDLKYYEPLLNK